MRSSRSPLCSYTLRKLVILTPSSSKHPKFTSAFHGLQAQIAQMCSGPKCTKPQTRVFVCATSDADAVVVAQLDCGQSKTPNRQQRARCSKGLMRARWLLSFSCPLERRLKRKPYSFGPRFPLIVGGRDASEAEVWEGRGGAQTSAGAVHPWGRVGLSCRDALPTGAPLPARENIITLIMFRPARLRVRAGGLGTRSRQTCNAQQFVW